MSIAARFAARSTIVRSVALQTAVRRTLPVSATFARSYVTPSQVNQKDVIQELYLKELKAYKPSADSQESPEGQVKDLHLPPEPQVPELNEDVTADVQAYAAEQPAATTEEILLEEEVEIEEEEEIHGH
ncbi:hypothetical protein BZG36_00935 [Bifiguratus adelaidae]|uniref:ATP synthase subunit H, mitochondrial n=1 Tax=Bifiguratus adelaidae TaxID=1938954 RepID=A0A261Y5G7_9FUNG|nr:hypothetical protein BZG36_00935 [Bifiguratus adelaidae]